MDWFMPLTTMIAPKWAAHQEVIDKAAANVDSLERLMNFQWGAFMQSRSATERDARALEFLDTKEQFDAAVVALQAALC